MSAEAVLITGSDTGKREKYLAAALTAIGERIGTITKTSTIHESEPWGTVVGHSEQNDSGKGFLNQVIMVLTELEPEELLTVIKEIERENGRNPAEYASSGFDRDGRRIYSSRTLDIDILFYGDAVIDTPELKVPHPLIGEREFVLAPLNEIMPNLIHPVSGRTIDQLYKEIKQRTI